jgi:hypothetical protein
LTIGAAPAGASFEKTARISEAPSGVVAPDAVRSDIVARAGRPADRADLTLPPSSETTIAAPTNAAQ